MADGKGTAAKTKPFISKENAQNRLDPTVGVQGDFGRFCVSGANRQLGSKKEVPAMPPYAELSQERMGVWKRTPIFLRREVMTAVDMKTGFFVEKIGGTIFVVNAMPAENARHTQEEIVKNLIEEEAMALQKADIA